MAVLEVYEYPHPVLKKKAVKVEKVDDALRKLMDDMLETMYSAVGVGLAGAQIGRSVRVLVIDYEQEEDENGNRIKGNPRYFVNPEIIWHSDEKVCGEEGCLSVPGQRAEVERFEKIRVRYLDYDGKEQEVLADDFLAIVLQHEMDHLDGILYIDRISRLKRNMLLKKLAKFREEEKEDS